MELWKPTVELSAREQRLLKLAGKSRKLFVFLREHRHELFDDAFQEELGAMYRQTGQGQTPREPALMLCMALLLQAYLQTSDAEAVRLSTTDRCWQMVLGTLEENEGEPSFSQGGLQQFKTGSSPRRWTVVCSSAPLSWRVSVRPSACAGGLTAISG